MKLKKLLSEVTGKPLMKVISNPYAKAFVQVNEEEQETYTATNKETGNVAVFKSKASRDAAVKSGSHEMRKSDKQGPVSDPTKKDTSNMFSKDTGYDAGGEEPKSEPSQPKREGDPQVNKETLSKAKKLGITPQKLGEEEYQKKMAQAAVAALTDANYHTEARELIAKLEGKPEWAEDPRKSAPSIDSPEYDDWAKSSVYSSEYYDAEGEVEELGIEAANSARWDGVKAADSIAFTLRQNGFDELADSIQSVVKENKSTKLKDLV